MNLSLLDGAAIALYLAATLAVGLYFRRRASAGTESYFAGGRTARWWLAGTSMVATTFAADTPLVVAGLVYTQGVAGNWLWWSFLPSGMMTVFLFARLWRRSGLLTDVAFAELRYSGPPAAFLRGFRALYLGLLMNCLILGWVTKAMMTILAAALGVSESAALLLCIFVLIPFTGLYVALGGLWSVLWTDLFQFFFMMLVVVLVAWYGVSAAGGLDAMLEKLAAMRAATGAADPTALLPDFSRGLAAETLWTLPVLTFVVFLGVQWWASWYPGSEPGGGGYIAQRIFSARDERHGLLAVLWFNVAHYALRPWPWILTALAALVLYPDLERPESGYMMVVTEHVPAALRGLVLAGFLAAFMSTVTTHLNWGASYLVQDLYRRFLRPQATEAHYVTAGRAMTVFLVVVTGGVAAQLATIREGWQFVLQIGAGTGLVYLLRWYWWRINAWSEISAMATALAVALGLRWLAPFAGTEPLVFAKGALATAAVTTVVWVLVTLLTRPEPEAVLLRFYRQVRPDARGWRPVAALAPEMTPARDLGANLAAWALGCAMVYAALLGAGKLLLGAPAAGAALLAAAAACGAALSRRLARRPGEQDAYETH
jgi:SSS family solute:Na+ symporter